MRRNDEEELLPVIVEEIRFDQKRFNRDVTTCTKRNQTGVWFLMQPASSKATYVMGKLSRFCEKESVRKLIESGKPCWMKVKIYTGYNGGRRPHQRNKYCRKPPYAIQQFLMIMYSWLLKYRTGVMKAFQSIELIRRTGPWSGFQIECGYLQDGNGPREKLTVEQTI